MSDNSQNWLGLFELFESASGLKLRVNIADTILVKDGRVVGWFFTSRDGVVTRASNHEISTQAIFQKLAGSQVSSANFNPYNYVALAHYDSGTSRPLKQQELQQMLQNIVGPHDSPYQWPDAVSDCPFCIQAYITPLWDMRYITSYGGAEGYAACTTFARRYSLRYTHVFDAPAMAGPSAPAAASPAGRAASAAASAINEEPHPLTAEEMLVESQLVALGLLDPREETLYEGGYGVTAPPPQQQQPAEACLPASKAVKVEVQKVVQTLLSFIERAHGLRIQGLVAEFVQSAPDTVVLMAVHAVQWDSRASRGRLGTFTERWADFMTGSGPAPAVRPAKRNFAPAMLNGGDDFNVRSNMSSPANGMSGRGHPSTPTNLQGNGSTAVFTARPGSAPTVLVHRFRPNSFFPSPVNGNMSARNVASASRRGAGGNAVSHDPSPASYALWTPRDMLSTETIAGSLALEVEVLREKLQRQMDISARAEAALSQLAVSSKASHSQLLGELEQLRSDLASQKTRSKDVEEEYERLRAERRGLQEERQSLQQELSTARAAVETERATLSSQVRTAQVKEESMEDTITGLQAENDQLTQQVSILQRRVEEGTEVIDAIKNQLVDYRQMVTLLQSQVRRGKGKASVAQANNLSSTGLPIGGESRLIDFEMPPQNEDFNQLIGTSPAPAPVPAAARASVIRAGGSRPVSATQMYMLPKTGRR